MEMLSILEFPSDAEKFEVFLVMKIRQNCLAEEPYHKGWETESEHDVEIGWSS